jgi:hypothetical protein
VDLSNPTGASHRQFDSGFASASGLFGMSDELEVVSFSTMERLWAWLEIHHSNHPGVWVGLQKTSSGVPWVSFDELLEAGIAYGWSESTRRAATRSRTCRSSRPGALGEPPWPSVKMARSKRVPGGMPTSLRSRAHRVDRLLP